VLLDVVSLKASIICLHGLAKELPPKKDGLNIAFTQKMNVILENLMNHMTKYISHNDDGSTIYIIYEQFDALLHLIEKMRMSDDWLKSVISRAYQYQRYLVNDFERIRTVTDFRTPSSFRGYSLIWLTLFPVLFGPYFANTANTYGLWAGIYSSIICSLMLVTLSNIYDDLEDPFDGKGVDDLNMEMLKEPNLLFSKHLQISERKHRKRRLTRNEHRNTTSSSSDHPQEGAEENSKPWNKE